MQLQHRIHSSASANCNHAFVNLRVDELFKHGNLSRNDIHHKHSLTQTHRQPHSINLNPRAVQLLGAAYSVDGLFEYGKLIAEFNAMVAANLQVRPTGKAPTAFYGFHEMRRAYQNTHNAS
jgi:hypothetical protein